MRKELTMIITNINMYGRKQKIRAILLVQCRARAEIYQHLAKVMLKQAILSWFVIKMERKS